MTSLPGLDLDRLGRYLVDAVPGAGGSLSGRLIPGGRSNLTYEVTDGTGSWIVRRPPLGHVLATAHDMAREYRVMTALRHTDVPVPVTFALCDDDSVIGAPFYVMQKVDGTPYRSAAELERIGPERTRVISTRMIDTLATLHRVDYLDVGLGDFGRPDGFLARQVRRWGTQLDASRSRELAGADELQRLLEAGVPPESAPAIVHGDFRLDNLLVDSADEVAAVLDWEMATIGDPLTDVGLLMVYQQMSALDVPDLVADASTAPGFLSAAELLARYEQGSGRDLSAMGFYVGLASFKLAVVLEGIHFRHSQGKTLGAGFDSIGAIVEPLIGIGLTSMKEHP